MKFAKTVPESMRRDLSFFEENSRLNDELDILFDVIKEKFDETKENEMAQTIVEEYVNDYKSAMNIQVGDMDELEKLHQVTSERIIKEMDRSRLLSSMDKKSIRKHLINEIDKLFDDLSKKFEEEVKMKEEIKNYIVGLSQQYFEVRFEYF